MIQGRFVLLILSCSASVLRQSLFTRRHRSQFLTYCSLHLVAPPVRFGASAGGAHSRASESCARRDEHLAKGRPPETSASLLGMMGSPAACATRSSLSIDSDVKIDTCSCIVLHVSVFQSVGHAMPRDFKTCPSTERNTTFSTVIN